MKQPAPMPGDYGQYGQKQAAPMPGDTSYGGYAQPPPAYSSNIGAQPASIPMGIQPATCKNCGTSFGVPEGAQSVSCPNCGTVHDQSGNVTINVTNNVNNYYPAQQPAPVATAAIAVSTPPPVAGVPMGVVYPAPVEVGDGPLSGYAPDQSKGLGHCCDVPCCGLQGERCCCNQYLFFTLCRQARHNGDGVCDSTVGHWCFYVWCYPFHIILDIIMAVLSPIVFTITFLWCFFTFFLCCCEHKEGPLVTACYLTSRSLSLSVFLMCVACCIAS